MEQLGQELDTISERPGLGNGTVDLLVKNASNAGEVNNAKMQLKQKNDFLNGIVRELKGSINKVVLAD